MKKYFIATIVSLLFSTVSFAADSIACAASDDPDSAVMLIHKSDSTSSSYKVTIAEGFAPEYVENETVYLENNKSEDILSTKLEGKEIRISMLKGFLNRSAVEDNNSSLGSVKIVSGSETVNENIICFIYE